MRLQNQTAENLGVVPKERHTQIEVCRDAVEDGVFYFLCLRDVRPPVANARHQRHRKQDISSQHAVVIVAHTHAVVAVVHMAEQERGVYFLL